VNPLVILSLSPRDWGDKCCLGRVDTLVFKDLALEEAVGRGG
jgi:hypothetical protein